MSVSKVSHSTRSRRIGALIIMLAVLGLVGSACTTAEDQEVADRLEAGDAEGVDLDADAVREQVQAEEEAAAEAADEAAALAAELPSDDPPVDEVECDVGECSNSDDVADPDSECTEGICTELEQAAPFAGGCADVLHQPAEDIPGSLSQIVLNLGSDLPEGATVNAEVDGSLDVISGAVANGTATVVAGIDHYGDYVVSSVTVDGQSVDFAPELASLTVGDAEGTIAGTCPAVS